MVEPNHAHGLSANLPLQASSDVVDSSDYFSLFWRGWGGGQLPKNEGYCLIFVVLTFISVVGPVAMFFLETLCFSLFCYVFLWNLMFFFVFYVFLWNFLFLFWNRFYLGTAVPNRNRNRFQKFWNRPSLLTIICDTIFGLSRRDKKIKEVCKSRFKSQLYLWWKRT